MTSVLLIMTIAAPTTILLNVSAQTTYFNSYIYIAVNSKTVGLNQELILITWTADIPPINIEMTHAERGWQNLQIIITDPDGVNTTIPIQRTDSTGSAYVVFVPTEKTGTYTAQAFFPTQTLKISTDTQRTYSEAFSPSITFQVQSQPVPIRTDTPGPQDYWTRPIASNMHLYYTLAGNWIGGAANQWPQGSANEGSSYYSYSPGPGSAHILWTKSYWAGGIMDNRFDSAGFAQYHYQGLSFSAVVIDGKIHYQPRYTHANAQGWAVADLYTGETLHENYTDLVPTFGQIYAYDSPNQHGGFPYLYRQVTYTDLPDTVRLSNVTLNPDLTIAINSGASNINKSTIGSNAFGTIWELLDAHTLQHITYIANVSTGGTPIYGKDGSILRYNTATLGTRSYMTIWNTSAGTMVSGVTGTDVWQWRPAGGGGGGSSTPFWGASVAYNIVHDGSLMITGNFSIPSLLGPSNDLLNQTATLQAIREGEYAIFATPGRNDERGVVPALVFAIDLSNGNEGKELWRNTLTPPYASTASNASIVLTGVYSIDKDTATVAYHSTKLLQRWGFDAKTGAQLWTVSAPQADYFGFNTNRYGNTLLSSGYGGVLIAIDLRSGYIWNYTAANEYLGDSVFGNYPMNVGAVSNDGRIYIGSGQHSPGPILENGNLLQCINASNGALLWNFPVYGVAMPSGNAGSNFVISDGRLIALNAYDNQLYCFGRGPSATTVSVSSGPLFLGNKVTLSGTVTDQTLSGRLNTNDKLDFSLKGTPAISDADQTDWMQHLFQQGPAPMNATGVPVSLFAIDPNNNYVAIGETTSDANGNYAYTFEPNIPGTYHIFATFAGSEAYGPSSSTTFLTVGEAISPTQNPSQPPGSAADAFILPAFIGIIIAIVLSLIAIALLLRKR
ncbi:MAG: PQQ-binding-like beta-propeller repeat protein [Nitrososphaerota archaeon]|nr:PQQ-binding-like beta-propeller repeat protein [Nitrososphaerota archaeon]